jgi:hypothetical protein
MLRRLLAFLVKRLACQVQVLEIDGLAALERARFQGQRTNAMPESHPNCTRIVRPCFSSPNTDHPLCNAALLTGDILATAHGVQAYGHDCFESRLCNLWIAHQILEYG